MSKSKTPTLPTQAASKSPKSQQTPGTPRSRSRRKAVARSRSKNRSGSNNTSVTKYEILPVRPDVLPSVWGLVAPHLQRAIDVCHGRITLEQVATAALEGEYLVWVVTNVSSGTIVAAYTTRLGSYPNRNALAVDLVGGSELSRWVEQAFQKIEQHARRCDCDLIEGFGRPAWGRILARDGWEPAYMTYHKELRSESRQGQQTQ